MPFIGWNTGYGLTGPSVSKGNRCFPINLFTSAEAFLGVLYAGVAGAVMMGKIMRYNAVAPIKWSDALILRYGDGVQVEGSEAENLVKNADNSNSECSEEDKKEDESKPLPYPIIEFRIANEAFSRDGGEIANAKVQGECTCMAVDLKAMFPMVSQPFSISINIKSGPAFSKRMHLVGFGTLQERRIVACRANSDVERRRIARSNPMTWNIVDCLRYQKVQTNSWEACKEGQAIRERFCPRLAAPITVLLQ
jgi:hypothetical protein